MNHAIEILEERESYLKSLIRKCKENSDYFAQAIPTDKYERQLADVQEALNALDHVPLNHDPIE